VYNSASVVKKSRLILSKEIRYGTTSDEQGKEESQERLFGADADEQRPEAHKSQASGWPVGERAKNHEVRQKGEK